MFKDAIDQMKDDEYIEKLHRQISGLKSDIEMVDQQNLSIMKTAEKHKRKAEKLEQQNKHYRETIEKALAECVKDKLYTAENILSKALEESE